ncbi:MAG: ribonuclease P [Asgard group archaeon]|nr:ribonuclease P [Asgard group archaeon]
MNYQPKIVSNESFGVINVSYRRRDELKKIKKIAQERVDILLTRADEIYSHDPELAQRYGDLARKIAMKARIRMPEKWRMRYCHHCKKYLYPGITSKVRIKAKKPSRVVHFCIICGEKARVKMLEKNN